MKPGEAPVEPCPGCPVPAGPADIHPILLAVPSSTLSICPGREAEQGLQKAIHRPQRDPNPHLPQCGHGEGGELPHGPRDRTKTNPSQICPGWKKILIKCNKQPPHPPQPRPK